MLLAERARTALSEFSLTRVTLSITSFLQSNEVNQGDALEHNFSAMHSALLFPITQLLPGTPLQQVCLS